MVPIFSCCQTVMVFINNRSQLNQWLSWSRNSFQSAMRSRWGSSWRMGDYLLYQTIQEYGFFTATSTGILKSVLLRLSSRDRKSHSRLRIFQALYQLAYQSESKVRSTPPSYYPTFSPSILSSSLNRAWSRVPKPTKDPSTPPSIQLSFKVSKLLL